MALVTVRPDFKRILDLIPSKSKVLDLGCANGDLLLYLKQEKEIDGQGVEKSIEGMNECIEKGITVFQGDILEGLKDFGKNSFDFVILSQTLHELPNPDNVIKEMLRVGKNIIVSFFNLAYYKYRWSFFLKGKFPDNFPYSWKSTYASILTLNDFNEYCKENSITIFKKIFLNGQANEIGNFLANLRAQVVLFVLE